MFYTNVEDEKITAKNVIFTLVCCFLTSFAISIFITPKIVEKRLIDSFVKKQILKAHVEKNLIDQFQDEQHENHKFIQKYS